MDYRKLNNWIAWVVFAFTFAIYAMTVAPTVSYWDCGEFIAASYKLAVPHPPGAPFYLLIGKLFSMLPFAEDIGLRVNMISVFSSAFTVMLLHLVIVHLIREWRGKIETPEDWYMAIFSGVLGSLTFAFTHSFWFNASEAEVYAPSMLFTALIVWLVMVWAEKSEDEGNEKYLLMIAYIIGLAIGVHLLNVLALPFVTMVIYFKKYEFSIKTFLINIGLTILIIISIYPGIVKYLPLLALEFSVMGLVVFFIALIWLVLWSYNNHRKVVNLVSLSVLFIIIGYSTYNMIYIRSNLNPNIDENNPETIENFVKYLNREQYGDHSIVDRTRVWKESPNGKQYESEWDFFYNYQIKKMYVRYFNWQFIGMHENETDVDWTQFFALPFLLGIAGMWWHFKRDPRHALTVFALFFMTGLAIILYLNQPDPQPRERDYSYVGSFFAFSIWIGLGYAAIIDALRGQQNKKVAMGIMVPIFVLAMVASPIQMLAKNYTTHDRSGRYIAWDYSYNMLMSCEENAIIFTNGDNDTFPLWYLQEVDGIRTDVRIVNLSLLNTDWYIRQLKDLEPVVPIAMRDSEIDRLGLVPWKKQQVKVPVPANYGQEFVNEFQNYRKSGSLQAPTEITFEIKPTLNTQYGSMLRVQDYMILNIIYANKWRKPIYFAVTVAKNNMLGELQYFMRMDGLALKLVPYKNWPISPDKLEENLVDKYLYRGLQDKDVYYDRNITGLIQNYRTAFLQLAAYYANEGENQKVQEIMDSMEERIPTDVIPWTNRYLKLMKESYSFVNEPAGLDTFIQGTESAEDLYIVGEQLYRMKKFAEAQPIFESLYRDDPQNVRALSLLIDILDKQGQFKESLALLDDWISKNPHDNQAKLKRSQIAAKLK